MPSSASALFEAASLVPSGHVKWGDPIPAAQPGVYAVVLAHRTDGLDGAIPECPLSPSAVSELLTVRPELRVDGQRPTAEVLQARLGALWLQDESVLYIGRAGTSLSTRVRQYYRTPLGARRPHAGGWPLKTLTVLPELWVHYAPCPDPATSEQAMLASFMSKVSPEARAKLHDPALPLPFANLEAAKGQRKAHGITGARQPTH